MPNIRYVSASGDVVEVDVPVGDSIMQGAVDNMVDGIVADCGGACACATCHCYVDNQWLVSISAAETVELEMLEAAIDPKSNSRLSCQIEVTDVMDGFTVYLPESQF